MRTLSQNPTVSAKEWFHRATVTKAQNLSPWQPPWQPLLDYLQGQGAHFPVCSPFPCQMLSLEKLYAILKSRRAVGQLALGLPLEATLKESNADDSPSDFGNPSPPPSSPPPHTHTPSHVLKLCNSWLL